ncbi:SRPBCC domain-containing protein [Sporosarcina sp. Marseille-Q4063]|uniref:SRPBCC family protein n=1 Tax=Sporosarcina sp. Marseille-Q4063 TaxID=2810514 RepID=UPI001BAF30EF|nr:SRPBCC domain-containing protein [Sporosarcina sp. Marseille-Q4063]QUW23149.1 SRPBCC domain-containing protein [Sporosarcina sp. Marseille-Q4063]
MSTNNNEQFAEVVKKIVINAPIEKVWNYVATAEGIGAWFMPNDMEPIEGKEFILQAGPWGNSACKVTEVNEPNRLSFEWGDQWLITFELIEVAAEQTEVTLIHAGWDEYKETEFGQSHSEVRARMSGGWDGLVQKLKTVVEE